MGNSHFKSNVVAKAGTETITGFATISATALKGSLTSDQVAINTSGSIKLGTNQYIIFGGYNTEATIVAAATALTATPTGSLYLSSDGYLWIFDGATTATRFTKN